MPIKKDECKNVTCLLHETHAEQLKDMKNSLNRQYGLIFMLVLSLISAFLYMSSANSNASEAASKAAREVEKAVNIRLTSCMERINEQISAILVISAKQDTRLEDFSQRLFGLANKQTVILDKIVRQDERLAVGRGVER